MSLTCPYCNEPAKLVSGRQIYARRPDLMDLKFWSCEPCGAYVGCHKSGDAGSDGTKPLGRLADPDLRQAKKAAHAAFDPLWQTNRMTRSEAYRWLREGLGIRAHQCHIGMMDPDQCRRVVELCAASEPAKEAQ